jgi:hypothetical protein
MRARRAHAIDAGALTSRASTLGATTLGPMSGAISVRRQNMST